MRPQSLVVQRRLCCRLLSCYILYVFIAEGYRCRKSRPFRSFSPPALRFAPLAAGSHMAAIAIAALPLAFLCLANTAAIEHFEWSRLHHPARPAPPRFTRWIAERSSHSAS